MIIKVGFRLLLAFLLYETFETYDDLNQVKFNDNVFKSKLVQIINNFVDILFLHSNKLFNSVVCNYTSITQ